MGLLSHGGPPGANATVRTAHVTHLWHINSCCAEAHLRARNLVGKAGGSEDRFIGLHKDDHLHRPRDEAPVDGGNPALLMSPSPQAQNPF